MKLFITGISGLLGLNFALQVKDRFTVSGSYNSHRVSFPEIQTAHLNLLSLSSVEDALASIKPDIVIHTAALTSVDDCESNPVLAQQVNQAAAQYVAQGAASVGARLVHISTDHLYDGTQSWVTEADPTAPLNTYAETKFQGELSVLETCPDALVVRTNFYGWGTSIRTSFSDWILRSLAERQTLNMFTDSYFTPILLNDLIELTLQLVDASTSGTVNVGGNDRISKCDFAVELAQAFGYPTDLVNPVSLDSFVSKAVRPKDMSFSSLKAETILNTRMPDLGESLQRLKSLREAGWPQTLESAIAGPAFLADVSYQ